MSINIVRVNALPGELEANTIYMVKGVGTELELYVTGDDVLQVRHIPTRGELLQGVVMYSPEAPVLPSATPLWYDTTSLTLFVQYTDGTETAWVEAIPSIAVPDFAGNGTANTMARSDHFHTSIDLVIEEW